VVNEHSLLVAPLALGGAPPLELRNRAATPVAEEQHGTAVGRRHPAELGAEALIVRVVPALAALPRQRLDLAPHGRVGAADGAPGAGAHGLLGLQLDVELERLPEPPAARVAAAPEREPAAGEEGRGGEHGGRREVGQRGGGVGERGGDGGRGEQRGERARDVRGRGGEQEGQREEHEQHDEEIERRRRRRVPARRPRRPRHGDAVPAVVPVVPPASAGRGPGGGRGPHRRCGGCCRGGGRAVRGEEWPEHARGRRCADLGRIKSGSDSLRALFIVVSCLPERGFCCRRLDFPLFPPCLLPFP
jgi:hypothetical protein